MQPHHRISKACQECRRRKIRCDGAVLCKNCEHAALICNYRSTTRHRATKRARAAQQQQQPLTTGAQESSQGPGTPEEHPTNELPASSQPQDYQPGNTGINSSINSSISATHVASASSILQLYYGASSNFSFLQQIHQSISGAANPSMLHNEVKEGGAGLDIYGQRSLFFGTTDAQNQQAGYIGNSLTFLSDQLAESFLQNYLNTIYHLHPFQPAQDLRRVFKQLYKSPMGGLNTNETGILMVVLAIGATMTEDIAWAEMLAEKAKNIANTLGNVVNLQAVQISLLLMSTPEMHALDL